MLSFNTKAIIIVGLIMATTAIIIMVLSYFQYASAFSLNGALNKLFGGLFHKTPKQSTTSPPTRTRQNANNTSAPPPSSSALPMSPSSTGIPSACHILNGVLPDPKCTPGAINLSVTQDNIKNTICVPGFSRTVRPPVSYTTPLKIKLMQSYGFTDSRSNYELDHLVSLEIGGNPTDVRNLWPEPGYGQYNFHIKDRFENYLHNQVCNGAMSLSEAQKEIATDWISNWKKAGQP
ncbi:MAG: hypothetical protein JO297_17605 [Nitrososphaeraceae archaeon]|nr:hypothetical protein [Nitrososphaeraceae archaeon]